MLFFFNLSLGKPHLQEVIRYRCLHLSSLHATKNSYFCFFVADFAHEEDPSCLNQYLEFIWQLLQNIIKSTELQFPPEAKDLSPHCIDLCRKLLRRNPGNHHVLNFNMRNMLNYFTVLAQVICS